jgi:outer membrane protein OmpA-like peptidoglycan-associated protein
MRRPSSGFVVIAVLTAACAAACGPKRVATPAPPPQTLAVLLPDPDPGSQSKVVVSNAGGSVELSHDRNATRVAPNQPPSPPSPMNDAEIQKVFGTTLAHLPAAVQVFNLYFRFESDELTDTSRAVLPTVLNAVRDRPAPEVTVIGHTDTTGDPKRNLDLGLKRATAVRALLVAAGLDASLVDVASHGEADLLIPTPDETVEPRNRRVEITIR